MKPRLLHPLPPRLLLPPLLLLLLLASPTILPHTSAQLLQPTANPTQRSTVAVVNCVPYHLEILLGTIATLRELGYHTAVYTYLSHNQQGNRVHKAMALLQETYAPSDFTLSSCHELLSEPQDAAHPDTRAVVFVSGQEDATFHARVFNAAISLLRPAAVLAVVHNTRRHALTATIQSLHQPAVLLALSPRVHRQLTHQLPHTSTSWLLPTMPLANGTACLRPGAPCRAHFTIQGNIAPERRNYDAVQSALTTYAERLRAAGAMLKIVGAAEEEPVLPAHLAGLLGYFINLGFSEFYAQVQASVALVPAVASREYVDGTRITSTVVTSLITGVPILANREFMAAYDFLPPTSFYEHLPDEDLPTAMLRVVALGDDKHLDVRRSLQAARMRLQGHNMLALQEQLVHRA